MTPKPQVESHGYKQLSHPLWEGEVFLSSLLGHVCRSSGCGKVHGRKQQCGRLFCSTLLAGSLNWTSISSMDGGVLWDPQKLLLPGMNAQWCDPQLSSWLSFSTCHSTPPYKEAEIC